MAALALAAERGAVGDDRGDEGQVDGRHEAVGGGEGLVHVPGAQRRHLIILILGSSLCVCSICRCKPSLSGSAPSA